MAAAAPATVKCGDRVTSSITLTADVGPCPNEGLIVKADGITVDLGGHRLLGASGPSDEPGVLLESRTGVTVMNGEIADFGAAVAIVGGTGNTISAVRAHDNIGFLDASGNYGDGIAILDSPGNAVSGSTIEHNGPFDGIGVFGAASVGNRLEQNTVTRNDIARFNSNLGLHLNLDDGINLGSGLGGGHQTTVRGNTITANGFNGINACSVRGNPCQTTDNVISNNLVQGNGFGDPTTSDDNIDVGDGIHVVSVVPSSGDPFPAIRDVISSNRVLDNAGDGIVVASSTSVITGNVALRNGSAIRKFFFDVDDISLNNDCDTNVWSGNTFQTAFPRCLRDGNRKRGSEPKPTVAASALDLSRKRPA